MKRILIALTLLLMVSGMASAGYMVNVNFGPPYAGGLSDNLSNGPSGNVNGVTFSYTGGNPPITDPQIATVDSNGVYGYTDGLLFMNFDAPVLGALSFNFAVYTVDGGLPNNANVLFSLGGTPVGPVAGVDAAGTFDAGSGFGPAAVGTFSFNTPSVVFDQAVVGFNPTSAFDVNPDTGAVTITSGPYFFNLDTMSYDSSVPEPATFALIGVALIGLGYGRKLAKRKS